MRPFVLATTLLAAAIAPAAEAGLSTWVGPASGNWSLAANWSAWVPNDLALIDGPPRAPVAVTQNISATLTTLTIGAGDSLTSLDSVCTSLTGLVNNGTWFINSLGSVTDLKINGAVTAFSGTGSVQLSNNIQNRVYGVGGPRTLVNGAGHTVRGSGQLGLNLNLDLVNNGVIRADQPIALVLDLSNSCINNNLLTASGGGTLVLSSTTFDNTNGVIRPESGGVVSLEGATLVNGDLEIQGTGIIRLTSNTSSLDNVHIVDVLTQPDGSHVNLNSSITNDGVWNQLSAGSATDSLIAAPSVTLNGSGVLAMSNSAQNRIYAYGALRTLANGANHTIRGSGQIGLDLNLDLTNHGALIADSSAGLTVDCSSDFINDGTIRVTGAGSMAIQPSTFNQLGIVDVDAGRTLTRSGSWTQNAGTTIANGAITLSAGESFQINDGTLTGGGTATGALLNTGGFVKPGPTGAPTIGTLNVVGAFTQGTEGTFDVELGASSNDLLAVTSTATVAGKLVARFANGFQPAVGQSFTILTASAVSGLFNCVTSDALPTGALLVTYFPTSIKVTVVAGTTNPADLTGDGIVNSLDLALLLGGWGTNCTSVCCPGDINGDGTVNASDLALLLGAWGG